MIENESLRAAGVQFCDVSARNGLNMAQTVDIFLEILKEYYKNNNSGTTMNISSNAFARQLNTTKLPKGLTIESSRTNKGVVYNINIK